jgi:hypothetical protein
MPCVSISHNSGVCLLLHFLNSSDRAFLGLRGGSKRVNWKSITKHTEWYISETFLLPGKPFENPTRLGESHLRAYWNHWLKLSRSGNHFTFKHTTPPIGETGSDPESNSGKKAGRGGPEQSESEPEVEDNHKKGGKPDNVGSPKLGPALRTPDRCYLGRDRTRFLHSMCGWHDGYQAVVSTVAQMVVSFCRSFICI